MISTRFAIAFMASTLALSTAANADKGTYQFSGGKFQAGTTVGETITVVSAPLASAGDSLSFSCPITAYGAGTYQINWSCKGGSIQIVSSNKSIEFHGAFLAATMTLTASGGGRGSQNTDLYQFNGEFSGTITQSGATQVAHGSISQLIKSSAPIGSGSTPVTSGSFGWNSAYSPVLVADNAMGRIVGVDSLNGANPIRYGKLGTGTGQFTRIAGLTEDATGHIYATDSDLNRLVRIDNLSGAGWSELGSTGVGANHFKSPSGVALDSSGKIWVVDSGNSRVVRFDNMSGTGWISIGSLGAGIRQFKNPTGIAVDAQGRIYIADTGNNRVVRFDDATGKNWVSLSEVSSGTTGYLLTGPTSVALNAGQLFIGLGGTPGALIETPFPSGSNATVSSWSNPLTSLSIDKAGAIYLTGLFSPGLAVVNNADSNGYFASNLDGSVTSPGPVYARPSSTPTPAAPVFSTASFNFGKQNVAEAGLSHPEVLTNLGASILKIDDISAGSDYVLSKTCPTSLVGGASCTININFDPRAVGTRVSDMVLSSNGVHPSLQIGLTGVGTAPAAVILPTALSFDSQQIGSGSSASILTLTNTGTGPLTITSILAAGQFAQANNCGKSLAAGSGCTINVAFLPKSAGIQTGSVIIADDAKPGGEKQTIALTGSAVTGLPAISVSPENLQFADQEVGTQSRTTNVTLHNRSNASLKLGTPSVSASFKLANSCGSTLIKAANCVLSVTFLPATATAASGRITIPIQGQTPLTIGLAGTGTPPGKSAILKFSSSAIAFGTVSAGDSANRTLTITNTSGLPASIRSTSLTGGNLFKVVSNTCPEALSGFASCAITISFTPANNYGSFGGVFTLIEGSGAHLAATVTGLGTGSSND